MFAVTIKGKTFEEMRENAIKIAGVFQDADSERKEEKRATKKAAKQASEQANAPEAKSQSEYAPTVEKKATHNSLLDDLPPTPAAKPAEEVKAASSYTKDDLISLMQKLSEAKGIEAVIEVFKKHKVTRLTEVVPADYPKIAQDFIKAT